MPNTQGQIRRFLWLHEIQPARPRHGHLLIRRLNRQEDRFGKSVARKTQADRGNPGRSALPKSVSDNWKPAAQADGSAGSVHGRQPRRILRALGPRTMWSAEPLCRFRHGLPVHASRERGLAHSRWKFMGSFLGSRTMLSAHEPRPVRGPGFSRSGASKPPKGGTTYRRFMGSFWCPQPISAGFFIIRNSSVNSRALFPLAVDSQFLVRSKSSYQLIKIC